MFETDELSDDDVTRAWQTARADEPPPGTAGLVFLEPGETAASHIYLPPDAAARRFPAVLTPRLARSTGAHVMTDGKKPHTRLDAGLATLAFGGSHGLAADAYFERVYGYAFERDVHLQVLNTHLHRARLRLGDAGEILREGDRIRLRPSRRLILRDPRSRESIAQRVLRVLASGGRQSAKELARHLRVPLRTVQRVVGDLIVDETISAAKDGRRVVYSVEDTTFSEATASRSFPPPRARAWRGAHVGPQLRYPQGVAGSFARTSFALMVWLAVSGCQRSATQIVVNLDADESVRATSRSLRVVVCDTDSTIVLDRRVDLDPSSSPCGDATGAADGRVWWPACVPVAPRDGLSGRAYGVIAELRDDRGILTHRIRSAGRFVPDQRVAIEALFEEACRGVVDCGEAETCHEGACLPVGDEAGVFDTCGVVGPSLASPVLRLPWNGHYTGSVHAPERSLHPSFEWAAVIGATRYELQLTSDCSTSSFGTCEFESPTRSLTTTEVTVTLTEALEVDLTPPVGRRYFWRVRACDDVACSDYSPVRYLDVGRLGNDFNADGYSDLLVPAPRVRSSSGEAFLFLGGPAGLVTPPTVLLPFALTLEPDNWFGRAVGALGDINADGYPDAAVCANSALGNDVGVAVLMRGGPDGLAPLDQQLLTNPETRPQLPGQVDSFFCDQVAGVGDTNADGFADVIIGARGWDGNESGVLVPDEGRVFFYEGSAAGLRGMPDATFMHPDPQGGTMFGLHLASAGDLNGDGFLDIVIASDRVDVPNPAGGTIARAGSAYVYYGPMSTDSRPTRLISGLYQAPMMGIPLAFGVAVAGVHDVDHDGFGDLLVGARNASFTDEAMLGGAAFLFRGSAGGVASTTEDRLPNPSREDLADFGTQLAHLGDVNGDGWDDVGVADVGANANTGAVFVFLGSASGLGSSSSEHRNPTGLVDERFGMLGGAGDVNGDGLDDLVVSARDAEGSWPGEGVVYLYLGRAGGPSPTPDQTLTLPATSTGPRGGAFGNDLPRLAPL